MFEKSFENVTVKKVMAEKRGCCLEAVNRTGERILMDFCGMNPALVPDGTNAYLFGNSLIMVTRWSDMSDEEKNTVETACLSLAIHPYQYVQFSLGIDGRWSDVMTTLHHCYGKLNEEDEPVKEAIFIFADTHDGDYVISRCVKLPPYVQRYLQKCNKTSHESFALDEMTHIIHARVKDDPVKDYWDLLYDVNWNETKEFSRKARGCEPDNVPDGVYLEISSDNVVTNMYLNEKKPEKEPMSKEAEMFLSLAERGIAEAQYNMGVVYETGDGVAQNFEKAVSWYRKASDQGHAKAQYNLGVCIYNGYGAEKDHEEAARLFRLSAEQGDMYAQYNMGVCCYMGDGVEKNVFAAIEWFEKAADQGHPEAKKVLGRN